MVSLEFGLRAKGYGFGIRGFWFKTSGSRNRSQDLGALSYGVLLRLVGTMASFAKLTQHTLNKTLNPKPPQPPDAVVVGYRRGFPKLVY